VNDLKRLVKHALAGVKDEAFAVRFWDGDSLSVGAPPARFTVHLRDERACRRLLWGGDVAFGEAYAAGAIDIDGDFASLMRVMFEAKAPRETAARRFGRLAMALGSLNGRRRAAANVRHHYDLGNEFFAAWLGKEMAYSCAYFSRPDEDLDTAQRRKFEHICAKLRLAPGQRLLDIGCGWGGLLIHAATNHGIRGLGITLSEPQKIEAERRIAACGLSDRLRVEVRDYRDVSGDAPFDRVVSVGMFEHVGRHRSETYLARTAKLLREGGLGLLHTIGRQTPRPPNPWLTKHIFPGAYFPTLADIARPMSRVGLNVTDVEVWRLHYALTLDRWIESFEDHARVIRSQYGAAFERMWRLYLHGCAAAFRYADYVVWQVQFAHGASGDVPITRDYLYR
jgi:cyclopropane-fatty-acyl-phospholipid synthase